MDLIIFVVNKYWYKLVFKLVLNKQGTNSNDKLSAQCIISIMVETRNRLPFHSLMWDAYVFICDLENIAS